MTQPQTRDSDEPRRPPLRIAVYGMTAEGVGSGAETFPVLLRALLERGHRVELFAPHGYDQKTRGSYPNYRFVSLRLPRLEWLWWRTVEWKAAHAQSAVSQMAQIGWQREAVLH